MNNRQAIRRSARRANEVRTALGENYALYQYHFVEFFIEHLCDISRTFRGDLQEMIVLALVGQVQIRAMRMSIETGVPLADLPSARLSITASSIADVTGIPRETVRRKFASLEQKGWVHKNSDGSYLLAINEGVAAAKVDLSEVDARALDRVARMFRNLEAIILASCARDEDADAHAHSGQETDQKLGTKS